MPVVTDGRANRGSAVVKVAIATAEASLTATAATAAAARGTAAVVAAADDQERPVSCADASKNMQEGRPDGPAHLSLDSC